jgi:hypothetical protein
VVVPEPSRRFVLRGLLLANAVALSLMARSGTNLAASAVQIGAADEGSAETGSTGAGIKLDATDAYRLALLKMKGQLAVARALLQIRAPGAEYHLGRPLQTVFRDAEAELERRGAPFTADIVAELQNAVQGDAVRALTTVELAVTAINGSFAQTGALDTESVLALAEALLRQAVANYAEAVTDNEVVDLRKYQSGRGFVTEAEALVRHSSRLKGRPGHTALLDVVTLIRQAWPGVIPPPIVFDPPSVAKRLDEAVAAMEELR